MTLALCSILSVYGCSECGWTRTIDSFYGEVIRQDAGKELGSHRWPPVRGAGGRASRRGPSGRGAATRIDPMSVAQTSKLTLQLGKQKTALQHVQRYLCASFDWTGVTGMGKVLILASVLVLLQPEWTIQKRQPC